MYGIRSFCPHLNANGVTSQLIATNAVVARHLGDLSVTNAAFGTNAVDGRVLAADSVQGSHLGTGIVAGIHLAADSVDTSHLNTNAVNGVVIAALAVSNGHVGTQTLTLGGATHNVALGKLNALVMSVPFATQGVTVGVTHGLGRAAYGWFVIRQNKRADVYEKANVATQLRLIATGIAATDIGVKVAVW
jgi:hypothetical protein